MHDDAIFLLATQLNDCLCSYLNASKERNEGYPGCPCVNCVSPGRPENQAWDNCCDPCESDQSGGELIITVDHLYPSSVFPESDENLFNSTFDACVPPSNIAVDLVVSLIRCFPTMDEQGNPPTCEQRERAAWISSIDMLTIFRAVWCCLSRDIPTLYPRKKRKFVIRDHKTVGPSGGCVGSELRVVTTLDEKCLCPKIENGEGE